MQSDRLFYPTHNELRSARRDCMQKKLADDVSQATGVGCCCCLQSAGDLLGRSLLPLLPAIVHRSALLLVYRASASLSLSLVASVSLTFETLLLFHRHRYDSASNAHTEKFSHILSLRITYSHIQLKYYK